MKNRFVIGPDRDSEVRIQAVGPVENVWGGMYSLPAGLIDSTWHQHNGGLIIFQKEGASAMRTATDTLLVSAGMVLYVPPHVPHFEVSMGSDISGWFIVVPIKHTERLPKKLCVIEGSEILSALCEKVVSWGHVEEKTAPQKRLVETLIDELSTSNLAEHLTIPLPRSAVLKQVANAVIDRPEDMQGLDHWATVAQMSRRTFTRHFAQETGMSFASWKQRVKILASVRMLAEGVPVGETATKMGYQNPSSYIAIFRRTFNCTPKQYFSESKLPELTLE